MSTLNLSPEREQAKIDNSFTDSQELTMRLHKGANWFYWIAGLSLVNSLIFAFGGNLSFVAGLGLTQIIDAIASVVGQNSGSSIVKAMAVIFDFVVAAIFAGFGVFARQSQVWAFIAGMILYVLDTLLILYLGSFLSVAFHAFVLYMLFRGFSAARQLNAQNTANVRL